jgi:CHAT domain-containing protein/Tfp pilus assembly protein PilF
MEKTNTWILEIVCQNRHLSMSLYEKEQVATLKAISSIWVDYSKIEFLNSELIAIINRANRKRLLDEDLIVELKKDARLLYDLLLTRQIKNRLSSLGSVNLILSLDERLIGISWELLFDGRDFFCLKFNLGRSIHTQNSDAQPQYRSISVKPKILILANPTGDLKSAYREGLYIKNCITKRGRFSADFKAQDIDSNYVRKNLRDYDIVHFAGHCEYNRKDPKESGWVLSDGWVSARDFLALGESASFPSIIFANACQSARTTDNLLDSRIQSNVYGLAQAFLFAGARHYLGSFWRIEDNLSGEFAEEFYEQVANAQSIGKAVRSARLKLFRRYGASAIAWAAYVLYGDPGFVLLPSALTPKAGGRPKLNPVRPLLNFFGWTERSNGVKLHLPGISKKKAILISSCLGIILLGLALSKFLPTLNPSTYLLFSRSERLYKKGKNSKVIDLLNRIIKQDSLYLPVWKLRGDVYFRLGKFSEALSDYFDYARFSERKKDYKHLAAAYIKIAWTYHMWGDYPKSKGFYQKALDISRRYQDKLDEADAMARLAVWHIDKGNNEAAFSLLMKSSEINRQRSRNPEHRFNLACDYFNIAFLYTERDDYSTAKEFYKKSEDIFESLGEIPELSDYYFNMGELALFEKNYDLALEFYKKGLDLDRQLDHRFNLSSDYWMLGEFYWETGKLTEAEDCFKEAIFICGEIDNRPVLAGVYYDLGLMSKEMGQIQKAREHLSKALQLYKDIDTPDYQEVQQEFLALE